MSLNRTAKWWAYECGGVFCSYCGLFYDDYYKSVPSKCEKCDSTMTNDSKMIIDKDYRLSHTFSNHYVEEREYPDWLLELRNEHMRK